LAYISSSITNLLAPTLSANFSYNWAATFGVCLWYGTLTWLKIVRWLREFKSLQAGRA